VDEAATKARQAEIRSKRAWQGVPKVQWHDPLPPNVKAAAKAAE
jgi:hypothetical protein